MCVCSGSCIYTFMCTQMSQCLYECNLKIFHGQNKERHDGNPFLAMLAACGSVCSPLWVRLKNLNNYLVDRHKILTFNLRVNVGIVCFCKSQIC